MAGRLLMGLLAKSYRLIQFDTWVADRIIPSYQDLQVEVQRAVLEELSQAGLSLGGHIGGFGFHFADESTSHLILENLQLFRIKASDSGMCPDRLV